jgi:hypothetical protein
MQSEEEEEVLSYGSEEPTAETGGEEEEQLDFGSEELAAESGSGEMEQPDGGQDPELQEQMDAAAPPMAQPQIPMDAAPLVPLQDAMEIAAAPMAAPQEPLVAAATAPAAIMQDSDAAWELEEKIRSFAGEALDMKRKSHSLKLDFARLPPEYQESVVRKTWLPLWEVQRYGSDIMDRISTIAIRGYKWTERVDEAARENSQLAANAGGSSMAAGAAAAPKEAASIALREAVTALFAAELAEAEAKRQRSEQEMAAAAEGAVRVEIAREQEEEQKREAAMAAAAAGATQLQEERLALEAANAAAEAAAKEAAELREEQRATAAEAAELREKQRATAAEAARLREQQVVMEAEAATMRQQLQLQRQQQPVQDAATPDGRKSALSSERLGPLNIPPPGIPTPQPGSYGDGYVPRSGNRDGKSNGYGPHNSNWDGYDPSSSGLDGSYRRGRSPVRRNEYAAAAAGGSWDKEGQTFPMRHGGNPGDPKERRDTGMGRPRSRTRERVREEAAAANQLTAAAAAAAAVAGSSRTQHKFDMQRSPAGKPKRERSHSPPLYPNPRYRRYGVVAAEGGILGPDGKVIKWHEPRSCKAGIDNCSICMLVVAYRRQLAPTPF